MRERGLQIALMCLGVAVAAYAGCSDNGTTAGTTTGSAGSAATTTSTTTTGSQTTTTGSGTSTGASTTTGGGADNLGIECLADNDCGPGLKCLAPDATSPALGGGGPANGYCSKDCATDADCPGNTSLCLLPPGGGQMGVCLLTCDLGPALMFLDDPLDPAKCHGRDDVRCASVGTLTACVPTCGRDEQCTNGRVCDPRSAVCVDKANTGFPSGAKCDPMAQTPECAGVCVNFSGGTTSCSSPCGLGGNIADPMAVNDCGGLAKGLCVYSPTGNGPGDFGFCAPGCSAQDECQNSSFWCFSIGGLTGNAVDNGYCLGATPCPAGQSDCKSTNAKVLCTDTKYGPFCVDTTFPLGTAAPAGTSSSSGSGAGGGSSTSSGSGVGGASSSVSASVGSVSASVSGSSSGTGP